MNRTRTSAILAVSAFVAAVSGACSSSPAQPSSTSGSIIAPTPVSPATGSTVAYATLPVKLVVSNATVSGGATPTYTFELAYDAAFSSKIASMSAVAQGTNGQTTAVFSALLPNNTYYWHARADVGSSSGAFSSTFSFILGGQVTLSSPAPIAPANQAIVTTRPTLTVTNVTKTGQAGPIIYRFDISDTTTFATIVATGTVAEGAGQTSYTPSSDLSVGKTYYWRATASDVQNGASNVSQTMSFTTTAPTAASILAAQEGSTLWPGVQPPGTNGHATMGTNWDVGTHVSHGGVPFLSPQLEELQIFDLIDRGMASQQAIDWMKSNGYPTVAVYYPGDKEVIGFLYQYMADLDPGTHLPSSQGLLWNLVDSLEGP